MSIDSSPPGASVTLRGKDIGTTPIASEAPTVPVGRHLLLFAKPGYEPDRRLRRREQGRDVGQADPQARRPATWKCATRRTAVVGKGVGVKGPLPGGAKKLAEMVKARFLVVSDGAIAEVWDVESGNRLAGLSLSAEELSETAQEDRRLHRQAEQRRRRRREEPAGTVEEPGAGGPVYKKWWFWTAVGVVAVGGATAVGVVAANNSGGRPFNVVLGIP